MKTAFDSFMYMYFLGFAPSVEFSMMMAYLGSFDNLFVAYLYRDEN